MCGIIGFIGYFAGYEYAFTGLKMLLNRGYDSVGGCGIKEDNFVIKKYASTMERESYNILYDEKEIFSGCDNLIFHSRWCTHGSKTDINSHPHIDYKGRFALVHNGIIENYMTIKKELIEKYGVTFKSQTDTEVIVNLISVLYDKHEDIELAMQEAFEKLEGTWGVLLMSKNTPDKLYCARHGSPLLVGLGDTFVMVASEQSGFSQYVNNYICLNNKDIITLEKKEGKVTMNTKGLSPTYNIKNVNKDFSSTTPDPYPHWTLKEIMEQPESIARTLGNGSRILNDSHVRLGGLDRMAKELQDIDNIILLGCGTSYHAGLIGCNYMKKLCNFNTVQIYDGAEFSTQDIPKYGKTAAILISQSGESSDLFRCIKICKESNVDTIGIVNVVDSLIARETDCGVYLNAGKEFAVASTKAYTSQVIVLIMVALWFAQKKGINLQMRKEIITGLRRLHYDVREAINMSYERSKLVAKYLYEKESLFILGKSNCEYIAKEGSLKIKEIGYLHAEAYSSSALKHGPFALIEPGLPIIIISPDDDNYVKNMNTSEEIKARNAYIIGISDKKLNSEIYSIEITVPRNYYFRELLSVIPLQIIAYELALLKGHNPDFPKNLAKTISVE